jgi:putative tricarboxylic transport membrane protein
VTLAARDMLCGAFGLVLAAAYYALADALPVSLLSDQIGADGVPKSLAAGLALCSLLLVARAALARTGSKAGEAVGPHEHARSLGIVALGALYAAVAPVIGYAPALALLIAAAALYFGTELTLRLVLVSALGAALFWALFVKMLGVAMPSGSLLRLLV